MIDISPLLPSLMKFTDMQLACSMPIKVAGSSYNVMIIKGVIYF